MKKTYLTLLLVFVLSSGFVGGLYLLRPKPVKNGFDRGTIYKPRKLNELELKNSSFYINRLQDTRFYLGNAKALLAQFRCRYDLTDSVYEKIAYDDKPKKLLEEVKQIAVKKIDPTGNRFNTDGFLSLNKASKKLLYTYYYRNSFACLDVKFNVLYIAKTIDTNTVAKIELGEYREGEKQIRTMAKPGLMVNKRGYTDGNWYYIHSALAADNESLKVFNKHEVFDVYALADGKYSHSVYLPKYKDKKLTDFGVHGDTLIALYEKVLVTYRLGREVLPTK